MNARDWTTLVAALGHLALGLVSLSRIGKSPLALPLALLALDFFGWTFAVVCNHQFGDPLWRCLDVVFTSMGPAIVLHFVLAFVGRTRAQKRLLRASYAAFGALALSSTTACFSGWGSAWIESATWIGLFLGAWLPTLLIETLELIRFFHSVGDADEQARARLVFAALLVGGAFAATDLIADLGVVLPALAPLGSLAAAILLSVVALRFRLFGQEIATISTLYAASVAVAAIVAYVTLFRGLGGNTPALVFGVSVVTLVLWAIVREAALALAARRERVERLAVLGRFSQQMAHDLKNPLAALVGAAQVLEAQGPADAEFRIMIVEQAERIRAIVDKYDRLGRVEPVRSLVRVNDIVQRIARLFGRGETASISFSVDLDPAIEECSLDPDLVSGALENLVQNAIEAMRDGGHIHLYTASENEHADDFDLIIAVEDDGMGMDPRQAERAFDDFFTTKATGSGLGLAFARRVAVAHGGDIALSSKKGTGTKVRMRFPIRRERRYVASAKS